MIIVRSQTALDAALADPTVTEILIDSPRGVWITIGDTHDKAVDVTGQSTIRELRDTASVGWMRGTRIAHVITAVDEPECTCEYPYPVGVWDGHHPNCASGDESQRRVTIETTEVSQADGPLTEVPREGEPVIWRVTITPEGHEATIGNEYRQIPGVWQVHIGGRWVPSSVWSSLAEMTTHGYTLTEAPAEREVQR